MANKCLLIRKLAWQILTTNKSEKTNQESQRSARQKAIINRILDTNLRLLGSGFNRLVRAHKVRKEYLRSKMRFVVGALRGKDKLWTWQAYNGMVEHWNVLRGQRQGRAEA